MANKPTPVAIKRPINHPPGVPSAPFQLQLPAISPRRGVGEGRAAAAGLGPGGVLRPCCVCMFEAPNVVLLPCGHVNTCENCARQCAQCPACRTDIDGLKRVFF